MKLDNKKILILLAILILFGIVILFRMNYFIKSPQKNPSTSPTPTNDATSSNEKQNAHSEIVTAEDALAVIDRLYHEDGYELKVKEANELEIIIEKINSTTHVVSSEFRVDIKNQSIVNEQMEELAVQNKISAS